MDEENNDKKIFELNLDEYIIGKNSISYSVDIDLSDYKQSDMVSRKHALVYKKNNIYYIQDQGSKNGTNLIKTNNRKINLKAFCEEKLSIGDIIEVYKIKILVN